MAAHQVGPSRRSRAGSRAAQGWTAEERGPSLGKRSVGKGYYFRAPPLSQTTPPEHVPPLPGHAPACRPPGVPAREARFPQAPRLCCAGAPAPPRGGPKDPAARASVRPRAETSASPGQGRARGLAAPPRPAGERPLPAPLGVGPPSARPGRTRCRTRCRGPQPIGPKVSQSITWTAASEAPGATSASSLKLT
ncbi:basic proline-rich protein [Elephas maximus indicus]|uniref:basic proline-rich protein n=1 Tax=Elephas maximus indicus TaxID=99487 RepID=UPI002116A0F6|nr:basic proline-rich protein [Elephas maximus indicus]